MTITRGVNMITRQVAPFFIYSLSSIRWCISFLHFKIFKIQFHEVPPPFVLCSGFWNLHIYMPKMTLSSLLTWISIFYKESANFWYTTCFVPNLILVCPWFHGLSTLKEVLERFSPSFSYLLLATSLAPFDYLFSNS